MQDSLVFILQMQQGLTGSRVFIVKAPFYLLQTVNEHNYWNGCKFFTFGKCSELR